MFKDMDKKTIAILIALVALVVFYQQIWSFLGLPLPEAAKPVPPPDTTSKVVATTGDTNHTSPSLDATMSAITDTISHVDSASSVPVQVDTIRVETNTYTVLLSTAGGGPISLLLKKHFYRDGNPVQMIPSPVEAVPDFRFAGGTRQTSNLPYTCNVAPGTYQATSTPFVVSYHYQNGSGGELIKKYTFHPDDYHFTLTIEVPKREQLGLERKYDLIWNNPMGINEPSPRTDLDAMEAVAMLGESRVKLNEFENNHLDQSVTGNTLWAGVRCKYFAAVIIPQSRLGAGAVALGEKRQVTFADQVLEQRDLQAGVEMEIGSEANVVDSFRVYVGPMDYSLMSQYETNLQAMLDIGTTPYVGWIIKPFAYAIIWLLPKLHAVIPNYGIVIILFAMIIKVVTLPLSLKSFKSMNAMKEIAPKLEQLKQKHKNDPAALNTAMMKLYKEAGVNPISGCLPMLAQMPLFISMFSVFSSTILLRNAPFVGFVSDLSHGASGFTDPYIILVIIMIGAQYVSQFLTMSNATDQSRIIMYVMPLMMGFLFYRFAAGLVLYWTCFSLFSLVDWAIFRRNKGTDPAGLVKDTGQKK